MDLWFAMELVEYPTSIFDDEDVFLVYFFFLSFFLSFFLLLLLSNAVGIPYPQSLSFQLHWPKVVNSGSFPETP